MSRQTPEWHLYRSFLAVVREGSLSGAARSLGMTQPTIGRHIDALEAALGTSLFTRSQDGLEPTDGALRVLTHVESMASAAQAAQRAASARDAEASGTVRITASEIMGGEVLPGMLAGLRSLHPGIAIELVLTNRSEDLLRGDADIAVRMIRPTQDALIAKLIGRIDIGLFAHRRYLKSHGLPSSLDDLRTRHTLIGFDRDTQARRLYERWGVPLGPDDFGFRCDNDLAQLAALRAGLGIGGTHLGIARRDKNLVALAQPEWLFPLEMWLVMHRDLRSQRRVQVVFDYLAEQLQGYAQLSRWGDG